MAELQDEQRLSEEMRSALEQAVAASTTRTAGLGQAHADAAATTAEATSRDGLVRVRVNAYGAATDLVITGGAMQKLSAENLSRSVLEALQKAAAQARTATDALMAPYLADVPDLNDFFPGMPTLADFLPGVPTSALTEVEAEAAPPTPASPPPPARPARPAVEDDDEPQGPLLRGGRDW